MAGWVMLEDRMKKIVGYTLPGLLVGVVFVAATVGWVWNIVKLAGSTFDPLTGLVVLRAIGVIVPPVGVVMGYL